MSEMNNVRYCLFRWYFSPPHSPSCPPPHLCSPHRILYLYAEENAIDDTIYYLSEALRKGVISLNVFLKVTDHVCSCVHACVEGDVFCDIRTHISYISYTYCGIYKTNGSF